MTVGHIKVHQLRRQLLLFVPTSRVRIQQTNLQVVLVGKIPSAGLYYILQKSPEKIWVLCEFTLIDFKGPADLSELHALYFDVIASSDTCDPTNPLCIVSPECELYTWEENRNAEDRWREKISVTHVTCTDIRDEISSTGWGLKNIYEEVSGIFEAEGEMQFSGNHGILPTRSQQKSNAAVQRSFTPVTAVKEPHKSPSSVKSQQRSNSPARSQQRSNSPARSQQRSSSPANLLRRGSSPVPSVQRSFSPVRCQQRSSSPGRLHQRSSSPVWSQQRSSSPVRSQLRSSSPARSQLRSSSPVRPNQRSSSPVWSQQSSSPIRSQLRSSSPARSQLRSSSPVRPNQRSSSPVWSQQSSSPIRSQLRSSSPVRLNQRSSSPVQSQLRSSSPVRLHQRSSSPARSQQSSSSTNTAKKLLSCKNTKCLQFENTTEEHISC
ncbi:uncharacterized protein RB166_017876 [Leptodactylus fuscus]|uniref:uncharacterized protein LOC142217840 n=1 Tax=Leptodactylus fuscus TaxID=238119 RepID=UPI003F4E8CD3